MDKLSVMSQIIENISEGIIAIDGEQRISNINKKAKEIFGISFRYDIGHPGGSINNGDILIIGDNSIGLDDGGMKSEDLTGLGVEEDIPEKAAFVYIGILGGVNTYRYSQFYLDNTLSLSKNIYGRDINVSINFSLKCIEIKIDRDTYPFNYIKGAGHLVVLDGETFKLKFYQSKGFTFRGEDLKGVLNGKQFMEKIPGKITDVDVIGENILEVLNPSESINNLIECSKGFKIKYINKYDDINGRPVRCSIYQLKGIKMPAGAFLKFEDMSAFKEIMEEKESVVKKMMEIEDSVNDPFNPLVGESMEIKRIKEYSKKAALSFSNILILGESGTGKSILAKMIHNYGSRSQNRFVEINCGALSESLLESELFGYVPGAFTGAAREGKKGLIEYADGGTLFLDEISEMSVGTQVKLLHVIQNRKFIPVGGTEEIHIDVRFICASNRDLGKMVEERKFREDLYYRINVMPIVMAPLRDRKEDLKDLITSIMKKICRREKINPKQLTDDAHGKLFSYDFPGNVRELENILERGLNISDGDYISAEDIILRSKGRMTGNTLREAVEDTERRAILRSLKRFNGDKTLAMKELDIKKTAFYEKLRRYEIK